jgi:hypothetical protein
MCNGAGSRPTHPATHPNTDMPLTPKYIYTHTYIHIGRGQAAGGAGPKPAALGAGAPDEGERCVLFTKILKNHTKL